MPNTQRFSLILVTSTLLANLFAAPARATDGDPIAVRRWPDGAMSVETHWGLHIVIDPSDKTETFLPRKADQVVRTTDTIWHQLSRDPNQENVEWNPFDADRRTRNCVEVKSIVAAPAESKALAMTVDGATLLFVPHRLMINAKAIENLVLPDRSIDLLVISANDSSILVKDYIMRFVSDIEATKVLLNVSGLSKTDASSFQTGIAAGKSVIAVDHNTLAISNSTSSNLKLPKTKTVDLAAESVKATVVTLADKPWDMPEELSKLFIAMEKSSSDSQKVFAKLSVDQMNFKPSNGTHTPRWNTEHMMGRQLLFFSQIYNKVDPSIPVMDLNPKQMPPDYRFAHPDWDGKEESRQMQRVSDFTRRFAYLLNGLDVNKRAPGSRWPSLKALLVQMFRHYTEHTANTVKKFSLPGFPGK